MALYAITVFLSAFLLFQVQPIVAKMILPWFGGASAVWNSCMVFFQTALLLGYLYAHWLNGLRSPRKQAIAHFSLLAASLAALPILPNPVWKTAAVGQPSLRIMGLLAVTVGLPYFLLSSTSPLLQSWYARKQPRGTPYRLFAVSNVGSMLGLLSYPLFVEPYLRTRTQGLAWSAAYLCFAALCGVAAWRAVAQRGASSGPAPAGGAGSEHVPPPSWEDRLLWLGLAAAASVLLLSVTTHLTQDVAAIPLLWVLPLSAYLLSFILCFEGRGIYRRKVFLPLSAAAAAFMAYQLTLGHAKLEIRLVIALLTLGLFACCMACHGELARLKPDQRYLTGFYVVVSLGGALGGLFVALLAPNVFNEYAEFPIGLGLFAALIALALARGQWRSSGLDRRWLAAGTVVLVGYFIWLGTVAHGMSDDCRVVVRNFYGQLRVRDVGDPDEDADARRRLIHGVINHGEQMLQEPFRRSPATYFCPPSGIGRAMRAQEDAPRRVGILGLGCGTLAAYGRQGDVFRIYEINPFVVDLAQTEFTYLRDSPARVEIAMGDGRLVLESEPSQRFDLLVMDAFSGDSVPVHLVTREAFQTYFRHLKPNGILAVNISNKYLDLEPVMGAAAGALGKVALSYDFRPADDDAVCFTCSWTLIMNRSAAAAFPQLREGAKVLRPASGFRPWTDDYSGMLGILKRSRM